MILHDVGRLSGLIAASLVLASCAACGSPPAPAPTQSAPAQGTPAATTPAPTLAAIEPPDGSSAGHIGLFRWTPVPGADGYRLQIRATSDGRAVWDSPVMTSAEADLPATVGLEPEGYTWQVTALQGSATLAVSPMFRFAVTP